MTHSLPVIDLSGFLADPHSAPGQAVVAQLRAACRDPGFCYLVGHGVPTELDRAIMRAARRFFALPDDQKRALDIASSPHFRGYTAVGGEITKGAPDRREQLDVGPEELPEPVTASDPAWKRLRGPNQWPERLPAMRPIVLEWMQSMDRVGLAVLRAIALGLGQPINHFDRFFVPRGDPHLKLIHYPPRAAGSTTDQGVGMHHDSGLLSFVLQDAVGGLKVRRGDQLIDVKPRPGSYVMNLGEMFQAATGGYLRATPHGVTSPPPGVGRVSIAYFFHPRLDAVFDPVELPPALAAQASSGQNEDPTDPVFTRFGENYLKIRLRSHPDVAAAHYSDVVDHEFPGLAARFEGGKRG